MNARDSIAPIEYRTEKYIRLSIPNGDGLELGDLRRLVAGLSDLPDDAGLDIYAGGERVSDSLALKAVDE